LFESVIRPRCTELGSLGQELYSPETKEEFLDVLRFVREHAARVHGSPILHIEAHGTSDGNGMSLRNGDFVSWAALAPFLSDLNQQSEMNLLIVAAMCKGWQMSSVLHPVDRSPAFGIIGPRVEVAAGVLEHSMKSFYRELLQTPRDLGAALDKANSHARPSER